MHNEFCLRNEINYKRKYIFYYLLINISWNIYENSLHIKSTYAMKIKDSKKL